MVVPEHPGWRGRNPFPSPATFLPPSAGRLTHYLLYWRPATVENDDPARIQWGAGSEWIGRDDVRAGEGATLVERDLRHLNRRHLLTRNMNTQ